MNIQVANDYVHEVDLSKISANDHMTILYLFD